jgi:hypothetical protein
MFARIARFEGLSSEQIDAMLKGIREDIQSGTQRPGLDEAKGVWILVDREHGTSLGVVLFADEDGLRRGDAALNEMSPAGGGQRTGVEMYEVAIREEMG